jgi:hypothetical protein
LTNTDPNSFWTSALLGNDVSSISNLITRTSLSNAGSVAVSNPTSLNLAAKGAKYVGMIPVSSSYKAVLGETPAGTAFARDFFRPTVAGTVLGKAGSAIYGWFTVGKLAYDASTYAVGLYTFTHP